MGKVAVLGVFVADTTYRAERLPRMGETLLGNTFALGPGGKGSNQAVAAARMGAGVTMITKLGDDDFADLAFKTWVDAGVSPHVERVADSYTGAAFVFVKEDTGDNAIIIAPGAAATLDEEDISNATEVIENASVFMTQLEQPLAAARAGLERARAAGVTTVLNPAPGRELSKDILALCDYITPNETETFELTGRSVETLEDAAAASEELVRMGVGTPIITLGERGAYLHGHGLVSAVNAGPIVETTGAGDAFNGAFAAALSDGKTAFEAVRIGCATAGISVTRSGAASSMPELVEVQTLMRNGS